MPQINCLMKLPYIAAKKIYQNQAKQQSRPIGWEYSQKPVNQKIPRPAGISRVQYPCYQITTYEKKTPDSYIPRLNKINSIQMKENN
jgi:hypothetical protein